MALPYYGALAALALLSLIGYLFWRNVALVAKAQARVKAGAPLIDVDTPEEFAKKHIVGAKNIPEAELARRQGELGPPQHEIVVYARSALRSASATHVLRTLGYEVINAGPMKRWDAGPEVGLTGRWVGDPPRSIEEPRSPPR